MSSLPTRPRGRQSSQAAAQYREDVAEFTARILQIRSRLGFAPSSRGWCYVLENEQIVTKGEFDAAPRLINTCRKDGTLPLDICSEDDRRSADGLESLDWEPESEIEWHVRNLLDAPAHYTPISFWEGQEFYIEIAVEKVDLKHLFAPIWQEFRIPIQNIGGWSDLHCRAAMMRRFAKHARAGRRPVLLYCGDHDPGGLNISSFLRDNFNELAGAVGWDPRVLVIDRFGLDYKFIEQLGLTWIDNLETGSGKRLDDPKHHDHYKDYVQDYLRSFGVQKVEANALIVHPDAGCELCRQAILKYLLPSAPADYEKRLQPYRDELRDALLKRIAEGLI